MWTIRYSRASSLVMMFTTAFLISVWVALFSLKSSNEDKSFASNDFIDEDRGLDDEEQEDEQFKIFYTFVRAHVIYFIALIFLFGLSCFIISKFSKSRDNELCYDLEENMISTISNGACAFTLGISIAALLLLPVSIATNEMSFINDAETQSSILEGLWSYVFLFSNISLFILLPFAYFFTESEGFSGSRRGIMSRLRETLVLLAIVALTLIGISYVVFCLFAGIGFHINGLLNMWQYLPFLYSCISFLGALILLICTPVGIQHLFTVFYDMNQNKKLYYAMALILLIFLAGLSVAISLNNTVQLFIGYKPLPQMTSSSSGLHSLSSIKKVSVIHGSKEFTSSIKANGPISAILEVLMISYLWCASICGLYNLPGFCHLKPRVKNSSFDLIVGNCAILCLLSSALPLFSKTLGMTSFDLLADFGRLQWLGNYYVVLLFNLVFLLSTTVCLMGKRERLLTISLLKAIFEKHHKTTRQNPTNPTENNHVHLHEKYHSKISSNETNYLECSNLENKEKLL